MLFSRIIVRIISLNDLEIWIENLIKYISPGAGTNFFFKVFFLHPDEQTAKQMDCLRN